MSAGYEVSRETRLRFCSGNARPSPAGHNMEQSTVRSHRVKLPAAGEVTGRRSSAYTRGRIRGPRRLAAKWKPIPYNGKPVRARLHWWTGYKRQMRVMSFRVLASEAMSSESREAAA